MGHGYVSPWVWVQVQYKIPAGLPMPLPTPAPIKVERGVQQGDPMSCLLYNMAIEPLATALRASTKLNGIKITNCAKLITKLLQMIH